MPRSSRWNRRLKDVWPFVGALFIFLVAFLRSRVGQEGFGAGFQVHHYDAADYRFIAEQFFGVSHDFDTYGEEFSASWGHFLTVVPFRDIGVGTMYLALRFLFGALTGNEATAPDQLVFFVPFALHLLTAAAALFFFLTSRKRFGAPIALVALALLTFPAWTWLQAELLLSEPMLRIVFLVALSSILADQSSLRSRYSIIPLFISLILMTQIKAQWMLFGLLVAAAIAARHLLERRWKEALMCALLFLVIPLSLSLIHFIGFETFALTPGLSLHVQHTNPAFLETACDELAESHPSCTGAPRDPFWDVPVSEVTARDIALLDREARRFLLQDPSSLVAYFFRGLRYATNFPVHPIGNEPFVPPALPLRILDMFTWIILGLGLFHRKTFFLSAFGLALWFVPAVGALFSPYDARAHAPMAGMPLVLAMFIVWMHPQVSRLFRFR